MFRFDIRDGLDLPGESLPGQVLIEITDDSRVLIEHHRGIQEYSTERIGVNVKFGVVQVCGHCLELRCMTREQLVITGCVKTVCLCRRDHR